MRFSTLAVVTFITCAIATPLPASVNALSAHFQRDTGGASNADVLTKRQVLTDAQIAKILSKIVPSLVARDGDVLTKRLSEEQLKKLLADIGPLLVARDDDVLRKRQLSEEQINKLLADIGPLLVARDGGLPIEK